MEPAFALDPLAVSPRVALREVAHAEALSQDLYSAGVVRVNSHANHTTHRDQTRYVSLLVEGSFEAERGGDGVC